MPILLHVGFSSNRMRCISHANAYIKLFPLFGIISVGLQTRELGVRPRPFQRCRQIWFDHIAIREAEAKAASHETNSESCKQQDHVELTLRLSVLLQSFIMLLQIGLFMIILFAISFLLFDSFLLFLLIFRAVDTYVCSSFGKLEWFLLRTHVPQKNIFVPFQAVASDKVSQTFIRPPDYVVFEWGLILHGACVKACSRHGKRMEIVRLLFGDLKELEGARHQMARVDASCIRTGALARLDFIGNT